MTAIEVESCALPVDMKEVYLNRPFVYMIIDWENKQPLFIGTLSSARDT